MKNNKRKQTLVALYAAGALMALSGCGQESTTTAETKQSAQVAPVHQKASSTSAYIFSKNYPTPETTKALNEELKYQAAVQVYLWALPIVSVQAVKEGLREGGYGKYDILITEDFFPTTSIVPTPNQETIYSYGALKLDEPTVFEATPKTLGFLADAWQRPITDIGLIGPDQGKGGKYLFVPPGYEGNLPSEGYYIAHSPTNNVLYVIRGFVGKDGDPGPAVASLKKAKMYPYSQKDNVPEQRFLSMADHPHSAIFKKDVGFWNQLANILLEEPVQERDRSIMGMAALIGIEKGKPFAPSEEMLKILARAERTGRYMSDALAFDSQKKDSKKYEDRNWEYVFLTKSPVFEEPSHVQIYERAAFMVQAMTGSKFMVAKKVGAGSQYLATFKDADGHYLDGAKNYTMRIPPNVPINNFWSVAVYDAENRSLVQTDQEKVTRNSNMKELVYNKDGSVDLFFGPDEPSQKKFNWVKTPPEKGFFLYFRFYGPLEPYFDNSWKLEDVRLTN